MNDPVFIQEEEYCFPYHYIAQYAPLFQHCLCDAWAIHYVSAIELLLAELSKTSFKKIIDVGCGDGRLTQELARCFPDATVTGVDFSKRAISLADAMNATRARFVCADITGGVDCLGGNGQDVVVLMEVFEHIPPNSAKLFIDGLADLLVPDGLLLVTVPHANTPVEPKHFRHFTAEALWAEFNERFEPLEVRPFERRCFRLKMLQRLLINRFFVLNNPRALDALYRYYKKYLFAAEEKNCQRLYVKLKKR